MICLLSLLVPAAPAVSDVAPASASRLLQSGSDSNSDSNAEDSAKAKDASDNGSASDSSDSNGATRDSLPFPVPDQTDVGESFHHFLHCQDVVASGGANRSGAIITQQEHLDHCKTITDAGDRGYDRIKEFMPSETCAALLTRPDLLKKMTFSAMYSMYSEDKDLVASGSKEDSLLKKPPKQNGKLTKEFYYHMMAWNHEHLVATYYRKPETLNDAELAYMEGWASDALGDQYALMIVCQDYALEADIGGGYYRERTSRRLLTDESFYDTIW